jgi:hypothetical protein
MRPLLHILTAPPPPFVQELIAQQRAEPGAEVEVADLTVPAPDYARLVEAIFAADSIAVWH